MANLIPFNKYQIQDIAQLPSHITWNQKEDLKLIIKRYHAEKKNKRNPFYLDRDLVMIEFMWLTGGRIGDIIKVKKSDFEWPTNTLNLWTHKRRKLVAITLEPEQINELDMYIRRWDNQTRKLLFHITRQQAWRMIRMYGLKMNIQLHPHMFRHGLALHLMNQDVPIPVISARLGHSNIQITMQTYMKVTPQIQRKALEGIQW